MGTSCAEYTVFDGLIQSMAKRVPEEIPKILTAHLTVSGSKVGGYRGISLLSDEIQLTPSMLAHAGYDYVALGHIHRHQNLSPIRHVPVVYCGSIDRVDFGEAEEEKGFVIAEVSRGGAEYEFHSVDVRPFVDILIEEDSTPDITERFLKAIAREDIRDAVVKIRYIATEAEVQNLDLKRINEALKPAHYKLGYQRIPKDQEARRRSVMLSQDVQLKDALRAYLREHEEYREDTELLLQKAEEIHHAVEGSMNS